MTKNPDSPKPPKRRIVKDDSGERDGYWIGDQVSSDFVMTHVYDAIVADATRRANRRSVRIVKKCLDPDVLGIAAGITNEIMGTRRRK